MREYLSAIWSWVFTKIGETDLTVPKIRDLKPVHNGVRGSSMIIIFDLGENEFFFNSKNIRVLFGISLIPRNSHGRFLPSLLSKLPSLFLSRQMCLSSCNSTSQVFNKEGISVQDAILWTLLMTTQKQQTNKNARLISLVSYLREEKQMEGRRNRFAIKNVTKRWSRTGAI